MLHYLTPSHRSLDSETNERSVAHSHPSKLPKSQQGNGGFMNKNSLHSSQNPGSSALEMVANNGVWKFFRWRALPVIFHFFHS